MFQTWSLSPQVMWVVDFSSSPRPSDATEEERELLSKTGVFEEFVCTFTEKCLTLVEHSSREQTRHETDVGDEVMNDEEITVDAAIADTFQKMMVRASPELFDLAFNKVSDDAFCGLLRNLEWTDGPKLFFVLKF